MANWCAVCFKPDVSLRCGACQKAFYCTKEHQKMLWFTHKHVCGNALNSETMIPQPPLTLEEHKWYSLKSVPYKAGELQLLPAIHLTAIPEKDLESTTKETKKLLERLPEMDRIGVISYFRDPENHLASGSAPLLAASKEFENFPRYLQPFMYLGTIITKMRNSQIEFIPHFLPILFSLFSIHATARTTATSMENSSSYFEAGLAGVLLKKEGYKKLESILDEYKLKNGKNTAWKFCAKIAGDITWSQEAIGVQYQSGKRLIGLEEKFRLEQALYENYLRNCKNCDGTVDYAKPERSTKHFDMPLRPGF